MSTEKKKLSLILIIALSFFLFCPIAQADIITDGTFNLNLNQGDNIAVQQLSPSVIVNFTVYSGTLNATGNLITDSDGGTLQIRPSSIGSLVCTSNNTSTIFYINGLNVTNSVFGFGAAQFNITWGWTSEPTLPDNPFGVGILAQISFLTQYLWNHDLVGFLIACYTMSMGQWFFLILATIIGVALYLKIKNIMVLSIAWILTGALFAPVIPEALPVIIFCWILGGATALWKLFHHTT